MLEVCRRYAGLYSNMLHCTDGLHDSNDESSTTGHRNRRLKYNLRGRALGTLLLLLKTNMIVLSLPTKLYTPGHESTDLSSFEKRPLREKATRPSTVTVKS